MIIEAVFKLLNPYCTALNNTDVNGIDLKRETNLDGWPNFLNC